MKVSCSVPSKFASKDLTRRISQLGLKPVIIEQTIETVYVGISQVVADMLMEIYQHEKEHDISVDYRKQK